MRRVLFLVVWLAAAAAGAADNVLLIQMQPGGGYLVWLWLREGRSGWLALLGGISLFAYGIVPVLQPAHFGRVYAAYGGLFIGLSLLWGWWLDGRNPGALDVPVVGRFADGVGTFFAEDTIDGRAIRVSSEKRSQRSAGPSFPSGSLTGEV